jgi:erythromycin esterase-like protein
MALGDELFSIMFTAYEGSVRRMNNALALISETVPLEPAPEGSLEQRLHATGFRYAILPLGAARPPFSDWLDTARVGRIDTEFVAPQSLAWRLVADAMFFIDMVEPSVIAVP